MCSIAPFPGVDGIMQLDGKRVKDHEDPPRSSLIMSLSALLRVVTLTILYTILGGPRFLSSESESESESIIGAVQSSRSFTPMASR